MCKAAIRKLLLLEKLKLKKHFFKSRWAILVLATRKSKRLVIRHWLYAFLWPRAFQLAPIVDMLKKPVMHILT
jgi:hypothetical protein